MRRRWVIGTPDSAAAAIRELAASYDVDEVMVHPVAGAFIGTPADTSPARETTLRLLAAALPDRDQPDSPRADTDPR